MSTLKYGRPIFDKTYFEQSYSYWDRFFIIQMERELEKYITDSYQYYSGGGCESVLHRLVSGHIVAYHYGLCFEVSKGCHWKSAKEYAESDMFGRESDYPKWEHRSVWLENKRTREEMSNAQMSVLELIGKAKDLSEKHLRLNN